ncbi:ribonuclease HII [Rhodobacterales bacterium HKCCE2091]|nr:ribonuclease HII [Rhodobacterales bacterium HKCCE2091]
MGPDFSRETELACRVAGIDEVGRGPLAGPVTAAAVILDPACIPDGLNDSKKLTAIRRDALHDTLHGCAEIGIGWATVAEIDAMNIRAASLLAMARALSALPLPPEHALVDGNALPDLPCAGTAVVRGDGLCLSIAAASIVAKVARDRHMVALAQQHPEYGWDRNAGYPTKAHLEALERHGVTPAHRRTFAPVHKILYQAKTVTC